MFKKWICIMTIFVLCFCSVGRAEEEKTINFLTPLEVGNPITNASLNILGATKEVNGKDYYFAPINGGKLIVYNLDDKKLVSTHVTGIQSPWGCVVNSQGLIYISGDNQTIVQYDPYEDKITKLPAYTQFSAVCAFYLTLDEEDNLYFGTYPDAKIYKYDPKTMQFSDYGVLDEYCKYVRSLVYHKGYLYGCLYGSQDNNEIKKLVKINANNPTDRVFYDIKKEMGNSLMMSAMSLAGDVIIGGGIENMIAFDTATDSFIDIGVSKGISGVVSPEKNGKVYFPVGTQDFYEFDIISKKAALVKGMKNTGFYLHDVGKAWVTIDHPDLPGESLFTYRANGGSPVFYNFTTNKMVMWDDVTFEGTAITIQSIANGPKGSNDLYIGGYRVSKASVYNSEKNTVTKEIRSGDQTDSIFYHDGKVYFGTYTGAYLRQYDIETGEVKVLATLKDHGQTRIHAIDAYEDKIFFGTIPDYGLLGGAIAWYDLKTNELVVEKNIVNNQAVNCVKYYNGFLYGTTSVTGGGGSTPTETEAKIFVYDVEKRKKVKEFTPSIPGISNPSYIAGINVDKNGKMWGVVSHTLFSFDPETEEIRDVLSFSKNEYPTGNGRHIRPLPILFGKDDYIYVNLKGMKRINPANLKYEEISVMSDNPIIYTLGEDGNLYYAYGNTLKMLPIVSNLTDHDLVYMKQFLGKNTALMVGSSYAVANEKITLIDENNSKITPIVEKNRTLVPLRFIAESLGGTVTWENHSNTATIQKEKSVVQIKVGENFIKRNGEKILIDVPAKLVEGRVMLPLRAISEAFEQQVYWNDMGMIILGDQKLELPLEKEAALELYFKHFIKQELKDQQYFMNRNNQIKNNNLKVIKVANGNFEEKVQFGEVLANGFTRDFTPDSNSYIGITNEKAFDGSQSLKIENKVNRGTQSYLGCESTMIEINPNKNYKVFLTQYIVFGRMNFGFKLYDENKQYIKLSDGNSLEASTGKWHHWEKEVLIDDPKAKYFTIYLYSRGYYPGLSYFDSLMITEY